MAWLICGSVPQENFTLDEGPWNLDDGMLFPVGRSGDPLPVRRGTPALVASAILTCSALGEGTVEALLCGDTGNGKGSRELYARLTAELPDRKDTQGLTFHYLMPDVDGHNRVFMACQECGHRPVLVADAGFMYAAKMSGYAADYDLFTPDAGELAFKHFPAYDILPFWADDDHTILDCAVRYYTQEVWNGYTKEKVEKVEIFKTDGIYRYIYQNDMLIADVEAGEHENYFMVEEEGQEPKGFNWTRIPLIPFKYNKQEIPLIRRVKTLQDGINVMLSDFENNMQEDARNTILVLKNYDGENLGEFRHNLSTYGAVKVREDGGVETLQVEINAENYKGILELLKKSLIENARGYDAKDDRLSGNPNQMNIQSMYSDIDLDANGMETEFQAAFEELLWFINQDFSNRGLGDYEGAELQIVFNRDILINETESIENCAKSVGILSTETIVEQHPWVTDVEVELARLRKEKDEAMEQAQEYAGAFQTGNQNKGDNGEGE